MLVIYAPPTAVAGAALALAPAVNGRELLVASLLLIHFGKRCLETLFVHRYSGTVKAATAGFIGVFYSLVTLLISVMQAGVPAAIYAGADQVLGAALALYGAGELGNLWHHMLLARMREQPPPSASAPSSPQPPTPSDGAAAPSAYRVPSGGLFDYVTMPHYFFEITAWCGIALATQQLNACLVALGMASYLSGRAMATTRWYKDKFGKEWPEERRHLVPFVF